MEQTPLLNILSLTRIVLAGFMFVYAGYAIENLQYLSKRSRIRRDGMNRFIFSSSMAMLCLVQLITSFAYGGPLIHSVHPLNYVFGSISIVFYTRLLKDKMAGGALFQLFVAISGGGIFFGATAASLIYVFSGETFALNLTPNPSPSDLWHALLGDNSFEPGIIYQIIMPISLLLSFTTMAAMFAGIVQGKTKDILIIIGLALTALSVTYEIITSAMAPKYMLLVFFTSNLPEVIRTTFVARQSLLNELVQKEKKTIRAMTATLNHELNNPLAILTSSIELAEKKKDTSKLNIAKESLSDLQTIIQKLNDLNEGPMEKETYRSQSGDKDSVKVYKVS